MNPEASFKPQFGTPRIPKGYRLWFEINCKRIEERHRTLPEKCVNQAIGWITSNGFECEMKRWTIVTLLLALVSTWVSILALAFMARSIGPGILSFYKGIGAGPPLPSKPFLSFMLSPYVYALPAVASILFICLEVFGRSDRSSFVLQIVYTSGWLVFITLNFVALLFCCWQMLKPI